LADISHVFTITYVAEMLGEDEDWLHELSIDMFPEDGRLYVERGKDDAVTAFTERHRELETDHRRHASRRPRASPKTFNGVSIPRCSPEAYPLSMGRVSCTPWKASTLLSSSAIGGRWAPTSQATS
jgi:hypothetical protein